jgi:hypothetical protein
MLIGMFGFYQKWLPLYEVRIAPWRAILSHQPKSLRSNPRQDEAQEQAELVTKLWESDPGNETLLSELKLEILAGPVLNRPNFALRFYLKTDWSSLAWAAVLLQPDVNLDGATAAMINEQQGGQCEFDITTNGLRLRPLAFLSRRADKSQHHWHSYVGEAATGVWAMEKWRNYLVGSQFTWLTDCSGLEQFFESSEITSHMIQHWRLQLLRYDMTICPRPERMLREVDALTRYNLWTSRWRADSPPPLRNPDNIAIPVKTCLSNVTKELSGQSFPLPEWLSGSGLPEEFTPAMMLLPNPTISPLVEKMENVLHFIPPPAKSQVPIYISGQDGAPRSKLATIFDLN